MASVVRLSVIDKKLEFTVVDSEPTIKLREDMQVIAYFRNDSLPTLVFAFYDQDGNPYDLTTVSNIKFKLKQVGGAGLKIDAVAVIDPTPTTGLASYPWVAGDLDTSGDFIGEVSFEFGIAPAAVLVRTIGQFKFKVLEDLT